MHIFIDEAGGFQVTDRPNAVSCVSGLVVPEPLIRTLFRRFRRTIVPFRVDAEELKGSQLSEGQMNSVIRTVCRFDVLLVSVAIDMGLHSDAAITAHKHAQAEKLVAPIVPRMNDQLRDHLSRWSNQVRTLSNQLYVQSILLTELVHSILQAATLYYVQRLPRTLGAFLWRLDAKDVTPTRYEQLWSETVLPHLQALSLREPLQELTGANYSAFAKYQCDEPEAPAHLKAHLRDPRGPFNGLDVEAVMSDLKFTASHRSTGLQIVDMLGAAVRRACNGTLQRSGWQSLGRLMPTPRRDQECVKFVVLEEIQRRRLPYSDVVRCWRQQTKRTVI